MTAPFGEQLSLAVRIFVGGVFLLSSIGKLRDANEFVAQVRAYRIVPAGVARSLASGIIAGEFSVAAAFLSGQLVQLAAAVAGALLLTFLAAVVITLRRKRRIPCGCFGGGSEPVSVKTAVRLLLLLAIVPIGAMPGSGAPTDGLTVSDVLSAGVIAVAIWVITTWLLELPALARVISVSRSEP
jgi:uncharacterized membrane protein YphA (DoxX/SURF4 family)